MENKSIFELIEELCPNGVEFSTIGNVTTSISTGLNPRTNFVLNDDGATLAYVTVKEMTSGKVIISDKTDKITQDAWNIIQKRSKIKKGSVLLSGIGTIGKVAVVLEENKTWNCSESVYVINVDTSIITPFYFRYVLESSAIQKKMTTNAQGSTLKGIRQSDLKLIEIPVPPIEIQEEIVRILDKFTELTAELTAELECRKLQYSTYRDMLLSFKDIGGATRSDVDYMSLREVCDYVVGGDVPQDNKSNIKTKEYNIPIVSNGIGDRAIQGYTNVKAKVLKPCITLSARGTIGFCSIYEEPIYPVVRLICGVPKSFVDLHYLYHILCTIQFKAPQTGIPQLTMPMLNTYKIPIPKDIKEQQRIASILDKFDKLCNDSSIGLVELIELEKQRYEYYRDLLLTFKRKENE